MIVSIKHKGLKLFYEKSDSSKLPKYQIKKISLLLDMIDQLNEVPKDLIFYKSLRPHLIKGELSDYWSLDVSGNYRIIFRFIDSDAYDLDYLDTH